MKTITVTTARKRFGALLDAVQHEPVLIRRKNRDACVVISAEEYGRIHGPRSGHKAEASRPRYRRLVEAAVNGRADVIITGDAGSLGMHPWREIAILSPTDYSHRGSGGRS